MHENEFQIEVTDSVTELWAASADEPDARRWNRFQGEAANPYGLGRPAPNNRQGRELRVLINHADRLRHDVGPNISPSRSAKGTSAGF